MNFSSSSFARKMRTLSLALAGATLACAATAQAPQPAPAAAGQITHLQGMATAQQGSGNFRFLGQGDAVNVGETINTTDRGFAVVSLKDGTKLTLRPATSFTIERFEHDQGAESVWMRLFKGGARIVTGLTGKRNPAGVQLRTTTATVGIRGTSFDARLCGADCRAESTAQANTGAAVPPPVTLPVAARVVQLSGEVMASNPAKATRTLVVGSALFEGEEVRTGASGIAVLGFRDQSKVSINPSTVMRINAFSFGTPQKPDNVNLGLLRGGIRAVTGLIGRASPESAKIQTVTSTLGARGTGMDISCEGPCVDPELGPQPPVPPPGPEPMPHDGLFMLTWEGLTYFERGPLDVPLDRAGFIGADGVPRILLTVPEFFRAFASPRPDGVEVDWGQLFASMDPAGADGLYVFVRDGHVYITSGGRTVDLGPGEAGYSGGEGQAERIQPVPLFLRLDPYPIPELFSQSDQPLLQLFGVTLGQPGQEICRL